MLVRFSDQEIEFPCIWCDNCQNKTKLVFDLLDPPVGADLVCGKCKTIIAVLHRKDIPQYKDAP